MKDLTEQEIDKICEIAHDKSERYCGMFLSSLPQWRQDLKAIGKTEEEILKEFVTVAYWYGYMDGKVEDEHSDGIKKD